MAKVSHRPARVLVVEDEDHIALALDFLLTREGYAHERIADGRGALAKIREMRPDLVLLDVMLPGLSGYEICAQLRQEPEMQAVKVLMMTASGSLAQRRRGQVNGADGFIAKPFALQDLRLEISRLLAGP
ncbi:response regulator [Xinfangfangia sp. CPCC 101601]|uniref:Response regulator n=1 Tax=Pseudogemmobacter lacusdianii TaxID=3069608 RepID=A0ABU0VZB7_9RHOB|nr:response regulator [Xinfangfangia sp. CPCC 101601]MDQ2067049.1 response regulator [Xinfangfangia sp. CPCC 101601]